MNGTGICCEMSGEISLLTIRCWLMSSVCGEKGTNQFSVDFWTSCFHWTTPEQQNASTCSTTSPGRCYIRNSKSSYNVVCIRTSAVSQTWWKGTRFKKNWNHTIKHQGKQLQATEVSEGAGDGLLGNINLRNTTLSRSFLWGVTSDWCHTPDLKL